MSYRIAIEILANAAGLRTELNKSSGSVSRFAQGARKEFNALKDSVTSLTGKLTGLGLSYLAMQQMKASAQLDKSLAQIGQTADVTGDQVRGLRSELFTMSKETGQGVDELKEGFNALIQSGLGMAEAKETLKGINIAMAVTGANAQVLSGGLTVAATAFQFDLSKPGKALELLDKMAIAGRLGNAELESLSQIFSRVGVNASSAGMGFDKTLGFIEALSMVERAPERLATLADSTLRMFTNLSYMTEAQKGTGVKFFDKDGARRDAVEVLKDIKKKYDTFKTDKERAIFIQTAFGKADLDTIKGIKTLLQGDSLNKVTEFSTKIGNSGGTLKKDLNEATSNLVDQAGRLKNTLRQAADNFAQPINNVLADLIKWSLAKKEEGGLELSGKKIIAGGAVLGMGTLLAARYGNMAIGSLASKLLKKGGSTAAGIAERKAIEAATGVTPVFVTNWPAKWMVNESSPIDALRQRIPTGPLSSGGIVPQGSIAAASGIGLGSSTAIIGATMLATFAAYQGILRGSEAITSYLKAGDKGSWREKAFDSMTGKTPIFRHNREKIVNNVLNEKTERIIKDTERTEKVEKIIRETRTGQSGTGVPEIKNHINITVDKDGRVFQEGSMKTEIKANRGQF